MGEESAVKGREATRGVSPRRAAMDLLARREHTRRELLDKLGSRFPAEQLAAELEQLCREGLQSDARFAESFVRGRALRGYGPQRIAQELRQRGVAAELAAEAMATADIDWLAQLRALSERRFGRLPPADTRERARRWRFLQQRGFGGEWLRLLADEGPEPID